MDEFNKRACEAWTQWLVEMHEREEAKRQRRNSNEAEQNVDNEQLTTNNE
ncbi:hypothetical protein FACS1894214_1040 [Planctomycetales bacterium]|nr:hypothetical protein FACS1894214_1040 [Planctomycetales bacterium]